MSAQSHGELLKEAIHQRAVNQKLLAKQLGISRSTLYEKYQADKLDLNFIEQVGQLIRYDFSQHISGVAPLLLVSVVAEPAATYRLPESLADCQGKLLHIHEQFLEKSRQYDELKVRYDALLREKAP